MTWLSVIWTVVMGVIEFLGGKHDWVKEEINSKPRQDVM